MTVKDNQSFIAIQDIYSVNKQFLDWKVTTIVWLANSIRINQDTEKEMNTYKIALIMKIVTLSKP